MWGRTIAKKWTSTYKHLYDVQNLAVNQHKQKLITERDLNTVNRLATKGFKMLLGWFQAKNLKLRLPTKLRLQSQKAQQVNRNSETEEPQCTTTQNNDASVDLKQQWTKFSTMVKSIRQSIRDQQPHRKDQHRQIDAVRDKQQKRKDQHRQVDAVRDKQQKRKDQHRQIDAVRDKQQSERISIHRSMPFATNSRSERISIDRLMPFVTNNRSGKKRKPNVM